MRSRERLRHNRGYSDALTGAAQVSFALPEPITGDLIGRVEFAALDQALRHAQRHRRIVCPAAPWHFERTAAEHVAERRERTGCAVLNRSAEGIADGKSEHRALIAIANCTGRVKFLVGRRRNRFHRSLACAAS